MALRTFFKMSQGEANVLESKAGQDFLRQLVTANRGQHKNEEVAQVLGFINQANQRKSVSHSFGP